MFLRSTEEEEEGKECVMYALCADHVSLSMALFWSVFIFSVKYFQWLYVCCASSLACLPCKEWWAWEWETGVCEMCGSLLYTPTPHPIPTSVSQCFMTKGMKAGRWAEKTQKERGWILRTSNTYLQNLLFSQYFQSCTEDNMLTLWCYLIGNCPQLINK